MLNRTKLLKKKNNAEQLFMAKETRQQTKGNFGKKVILSALGAWLCQSTTALAGVPNGTWLSKPQISFHSSTNSLNYVMKDIKRQHYKFVFLDYRGVSDEVQKRVADEARKENLIPIVWIQSPQYRSLTVQQLIHEARHGDGIQIDDHFFANYSNAQFQSLSYYYKKPIFCSIQPFQSKAIARGRCNQLDVQCYTPQKFKSCLALADRLKAVVSLYHKNTFNYRTKLGRRQFNVFLWPYSERIVRLSEQKSFEWENPVNSLFSFLQVPALNNDNFSNNYNTTVSSLNNVSNLNK